MRKEEEQMTIPSHRRDMDTGLQSKRDRGERTHTRTRKPLSRREEERKIEKEREKQVRKQTGNTEREEEIRHPRRPIR